MLEAWSYPEAGAAMKSIVPERSWNKTLLIKPFQKTSTHAICKSWNGLSVRMRINSTSIEALGHPIFFPAIGLLGETRRHGGSFLIKRWYSGLCHFLQGTSHFSVLDIKWVSVTQVPSYLHSFMCPSYLHSFIASWSSNAGLYIKSSTCWILSPFLPSRYVQGCGPALIDNLPSRGPPHWFRMARVAWYVNMCQSSSYMPENDHWETLLLHWLFDYETSHGSTAAASIMSSARSHSSLIDASGVILIFRSFRSVDRLNTLKQPLFLCTLPCM